jgi:bifunctional DNA-binding transcriptional regulator/antitoxin component of YhaV-PrlF toxin-antitoxin module
MQIVLKGVDSQGRIVLPAAWRKKYLKGDKVLLRPKGDILEVVPREKVDLTAFFDAAEADVKSDLSDWHAVRKELQKR